MSLDDPYRTALNALAIEIGVDADALLQSQTLIVDGTILSFSTVAAPAGAFIQCICKVEPTPSPLSREVLHALLQANTLGQITAGSSFGLQFESDTVVLGQRYPLDFPPEALARACRAQCETSRVWAAALAEGLPA